MPANEQQTLAHLIVSLMVNSFGVSANGAVHSKDLFSGAQTTLNLPFEVISAGVEAAANAGWLVQQENGLLRLTDTGFATVKEKW